MKKQYLGYAAWLVSAFILYFFENDTGSRIILFCSLLLPLIPSVRQSLFGQKRNTGSLLRAFSQTVEALREAEEEDPGSIRTYLPGDPVNRIHWKLSARQDELLVREPASGRPAEEPEKRIRSAAIPVPESGSKKQLFRTGSILLLLSLALLFAVPSAREGLKTLLNHLFDASEAVNTYVYDRFAVSPDASVPLAVLLLTIPAFILVSMALLAESRLPVLGLMTVYILFQVYFGLAAPGWANVPLFALFALRMMRPPRDRKAVLFSLAGILALSLILLLAWPGVDAPTEAASESVRDSLSRMAQHITGTVQELPAGENETRHVHTQTLVSGSQEARPDRTFRLVTVEEEQISMPHWIDYLRILLLLILTAGLILLPFLPFVLLNRRRRKALEARKAFQSENVSEAVFAIFQHVILWLEATGNGQGNASYSQWHADLSPGYDGRFAQCEKLFEEAAYSTHPMQEEQRQQMMALLAETELTLRQKAGWKQRLRLKYKEWLWV